MIKYNERHIDLPTLLKIIPACVSDIDSVDNNRRFQFEAISKQKLLETMDDLGRIMLGEEMLSKMEKIRFDETGLTASQRSADVSYYYGTAIDWTVYPYEGCNLFRYKGSNNCYLVYLEMGGHAAQLRCRPIVREFIINKEIEGYI